MESSPGQKKQPAQGLFQCSTCQRTFARVDHLSRHVRSRESHDASPWDSSALVLIERYRSTGKAIPMPEM